MERACCQNQEIKHTKLDVRLPRLDSNDDSLKVAFHCVTCGSAWSSDGTIGRLKANDRLKLKALEMIGETGTADSLGLPDWGHTLLAVHEAPIGSQALNVWEQLSDTDLKRRIYNAIGLTPGGMVSPPMIMNVPTISIDGRVIRHILDNGKAHHVKYAPLLRTTISDPLEVWLTDHAGKADQVLYLRKYQERASEITLLAVGDQPGEFLRSAYRLSGRGQAQSLRKGRLLHCGWILK